MKRFLLLLLAVISSLTLLFSCTDSAGADGGEGEGEGEGGFTPVPDTTVYDDTEGFDYIKTDLSGFVQVDTARYQPFSAKVNIAPPRLGENGGLSDVDIYILGLLRAAKSKTATTEDFVSEGVIGAGDVVKIYYRGYVVGEDGELTEKEGMCNFESEKPHSLEIGSGGFVPGFEYSMVGKNPKDFARFSDLDGEGKLPEGKTALTVECYFPYSYGATDLQNKNAIFEVYVEGILDYTAPDWDVDFLASYLEGRTDVTRAMLEKYEGETLNDKFEAYYAEKLTDEYEENKLALAKEAIANDLFEAAKILKYPRANVNAFVDPYVFNLTEEFRTSGGVYSGSVYATLEGYAAARLGISSSKLDWISYLRDAAKNYVSQRLIIHYLADALEIMPDDATFGTMIDEMKEEYLDEYVEQMMARAGKTREDYTDAQYAAFVQECAVTLFNEYDDDYFKDNRVYRLIVDEVAKTVVITTPYDAAE